MRRQAQANGDARRAERAGRALRIDRRNLAKLEADLGALRRGEIVPNLTIAGAEAELVVLRAAIAHKAAQLVDLVPECSA